MKALRRWQMMAVAVMATVALVAAACSPSSAIGRGVWPDGTGMGARGRRPGHGSAGTQCGDRNLAHGAILSPGGPRTPCWSLLHLILLD